ncbi:MAG: response regulator [Clostridiales bacterium]|nr:response regulator [Clostridiales bacterium]
MHHTKEMPAQPRRRAGLRWVSLVLSMVVLAVLLVLLWGQDQKNVLATTNETIDFLKEQVVRYDNYVTNDKTKSLIRLLDKTAELSRCLGLSGTADQDIFDDYVYNQRLTGAVVVDETLRPIQQSSADGDTYAYWYDMLHSQNVTSIITYPAKSYMTRVERDGESYDVAVVARTGEKGLVLAYYKRHEIVTGSGEITMDSLFTGYNFKMDGIVMVTDGTQIIASNQQDLIGQTVSECLQFLDSDTKTLKNGLLCAKVGGRSWYGGKAQAKGNFLYAFFPSNEVYATFRTVLGYGLAALAMMWLISTLIRYRIEQGDLRQIQKQLRTIQAISSVYTAVVLLDIRSNTWELIQAEDRLRIITDPKSTATQMLQSINEHRFSKDSREDFAAFSDLSTLPQRMQGRDYITQNVQDVNGRWYVSMIAPQKLDEQGALTEALLIFRDITEQQRRELDYQMELKNTAGEAKRADAAKTSFLRRMSHDIRTPINGIRGMVAISRCCIGDEEKQEACRKKILSASGFLLNLVNDVLDMSKLESGQVQLEHVPFDLPELGDGVLSLLETEAQRRGVTLCADCPVLPHPHLLGSPLHLRQVMQNLVGNAVKYNREGGSVHTGCEELSCDGKRCWIRLTCADNGLGMSEEFQKRAFEPFVQEHNDARTAYQGTGLGLAITKELVERMGGTIDFTSKEGEGTTFFLTIPFDIDPDAAQTMETEQPEAQNFSIVGRNILVVEDNDLNMEISRFLLENEGASVTEAWNGKEAVELFARSAPGHFDVILMDVMMPEMDGLEATRRIRAMDRPDAKTVPIIAMTANAFSDDIQRSREAGVNEHLSKPLDLPLLLQAIHRCLHQ